MRVMDEAKFREIQRRIIAQAAEAVVNIIAAFYPDCDFTVRIRGGRRAGADIRVNTS